MPKIRSDITDLSFCLVHFIPYKFSPFLVFSELTTLMNTSIIYRIITEADLYYIYVYKIKIHATEKLTSTNSCVNLNGEFSNPRFLGDEERINPKSICII